jgi:hypothetical protein
MSVEGTGEAVAVGSVLRIVGPVDDPPGLCDWSAEGGLEHAPDTKARAARSTAPAGPGSDRLVTRRILAAGSIDTDTATPRHA